MKTLYQLLFLTTFITTTIFTSVDHIVIHQKMYTTPEQAQAAQQAQEQTKSIIISKATPGKYPFLFIQQPSRELTQEEKNQYKQEFDALHNNKPFIFEQLSTDVHRYILNFIADDSLDKQASYLQEAIYDNDFDQVRLLIKYFGANPNATPWGRPDTPLKRAIYDYETTKTFPGEEKEKQRKITKYRQIISYLVLQGADINKKNIQKYHYNQKYFNSNEKTNAPFEALQSRCTLPLLKKWINQNKVDLTIQNTYKETLFDRAIFIAQYESYSPEHRIIYYKLCAFLAEKNAPHSKELLPQPNWQEMQDQQDVARENLRQATRIPRCIVVTIPNN